MTLVMGPDAFPDDAGVDRVVRGVAEAVHGEKVGSALAGLGIAVTAIIKQMTPEDQWRLSQQWCRCLLERIRQGMD